MQRQSTSRPVCMRTWVNCIDERGSIDRERKWKKPKTRNKSNALTFSCILFRSFVRSFARSKDLDFLSQRRSLALLKIYNYNVYS